MNTLSYLIYLLVTFLITVRAGLLFYRNGHIYILHLLRGDEAMTQAINKLLLVGYCLLNLGYAAVMIKYWQTVHNFTELVSSIASMTGRIMLTLAVIHFCNMLAIYF